MASFAVFNYQFAKIIKFGEEGSLFPLDDLEMKAEEAFSQKQDILNKIIDEDYQGTRKIKFMSINSGDKEYIHRYIIPPTDDITIMRIANLDCVLTKQQHKKIENAIIKFLSA